MNKFLFLLVSLVIVCASLTGQGIVRGKVSDAQTGEPVIGANVFLKGTTTGTTTNLNGDYTLKISLATPQILVISSIEYITMEDELTPKNGEVLVKNFTLRTQTQELKEVVVKGRANRANENTIRTLKSKSAASIDYISSETIRKIGDSNVSSALARVPGVSTHGGFFTVRGIGDRYVKTTINGARIPTLDPFTNNIKLDLFPASLIDNIILTKTASPDLPGDWAGAYLSVETTDYPEKLTINAETSFGYNNQTTFKEILSSQHSKTDWLGFDNGLRDIDVPPVGFPNLQQGSENLYKTFTGVLPDFYDSLGINSGSGWNYNLTKLGLIRLGLLGAAELDPGKYPSIYNDPAFVDALSRFDANEGGYKETGLYNGYREYIDVARKLPNNWMPIKRKAPLDFSQSFSIGNQTTIFGKPLGFIFGLKYSSSTISDPEVKYGRYDETNDAIQTTDINSLLKLTLFDKLGTVNTTTETNSWSSLINLAYNFSPNHSISLLFMPNITGVNRISWNNLLWDSGSGGFGNYPTDVTPSIFYESRKQLIYQVKSEHFFRGPGLKVEGNLSYTNGASNAPDGKSLTLQGQQFDSLVRFPQTPWPFRTFRELTENVLDIRIGAELPIDKKPDMVRKFKFGGSYLEMYRYGKNVSYSVDYHGNGEETFADPGAYMDISNFLPSNGHIPKMAYSGQMGASNNIVGFTKLLAGYVMVDYDILFRLRFSGGVRVEKNKMHTDRESFYNAQYAENDIRRGTFKPYLKDETDYLPSANLVFRINNNLQAPFNVRFNYSKTIARPSLRETTGFTTYDYETKTNIQGNTNLKNVDIKNYDFRLEAYFTNGDNASVSLFYKDFTNHIEFVDATKWQNTGKSYAKGIEFEGRKNIFKNLMIMANITLVKSLTTNVVQNYSDTTNRPMYGQAPYIINGLLSYNSDKLGLSAAITYNYQGEKLVITSSNLVPNIYELPRHLVDVKVSKTITKHFSVTIKCRDLLGTSIRKAYKYNVGWIDYENYSYGTSYVFSLSYKL